MARESKSGKRPIRIESGEWVFTGRGENIRKEIDFEFGSGYVDMDCFLEACQRDDGKEFGEVAKTAELTLLKLLIEYLAEVGEMLQDLRDTEILKKREDNNG